MLPRPLPIVLAALGAAFATAACAQSQEVSPTGSAQPSARSSSTLQADTLQAAPDPKLPRLRLALEAAERGGLAAGGDADLASHPLYPWIEYAALRRDIDTLPAARAQQFLQRHAGEPVAEVFREAWLTASARRQDPAAFLAAWSDDIGSTALRCARLDAQRQTGRMDAAWTGAAQSLWRESGTSLPDSCDPVFAALTEREELPAALRWERIDAAVAERQPGVIRAAARGLPAADLALANDYAAFLDAPHPRALAWPKTPRSRLVASHGLAKFAKADPDSAEALLPQYTSALGLDAAEVGRVRYEIALWTVASYLPGSQRRLDLVPAASYDERLHEWRVREALSRSDWRGALAAIRKMGDTQRNDSRYAYFEARLAELTGDSVTARSKYQAAARAPEFHGFLAADRLDQPYALCPREITADAAVRAKVTAHPGLQRALGLHRLSRPNWAAKEWSRAVAGFNDTERQAAVALAQAHGWFDRAVFALGRGKPDELRLYSLRFPLHHDTTIRREAARNGIDPAWVAAEIRAESIFNPDARSSANAMGLMQVLPSTGEAVARRIGWPWTGAQSLYEPDTNIALGTAYLRQMLDRYGGRPYFAIAGYNAGPAPLTRWQSQRPDMDADFWIETISYKETRDYVARVLAFSVIYDWRLDGDALRLSDRLQGRAGGPRKPFACPAPATSVATAAPPAPARTR